MYDEYHIRQKAKQDSNLDPGHWIGILLAIVLMCLCIAKCQAQSVQKARIDTIMCHNECIDKFVSTKTAKGTIKYFAVYNDKRQDVSELIPVPSSVMTYIIVCKENGIEPSLAIRLRNGIITSLMRYKPKYVRRR